jgi:hypothetical protein
MASAPAQRTSGGNAAYHNFHNDFVHIQDPNERRRLALAEIDKAPFGWYHVRACVVAGVGFFTDSYGESASSSCQRSVSKGNMLTSNKTSLPSRS